MAGAFRRRRSPDRRAPPWRLAASDEDTGSRALANEPAPVLADEPTGSLDQKSSAVASDIFAGLSAERNVTVVMATHDRDMAARCDRQIRIVDGRIDGV